MAGILVALAARAWCVALPVSVTIAIGRATAPSFLTAGMSVLLHRLALNKPARRGLLLV